MRRRFSATNVRAHTAIAPTTKHGPHGPGGRAHVAARTDLCGRTAGPVNVIALVLPVIVAILVSAPPTAAESSVAGSYADTATQAMAKDAATSTVAAVSTSTGAASLPDARTASVGITRRTRTRIIRPEDLAPHPPLPANRALDVLTSTVSQRSALKEAGLILGRRRFNLAGIWVDGLTLLKLAATPAAEPLTRAVREALERPVDVGDFLLFIDDLLAGNFSPTEVAPAYLTAGRARATGVLLHPHDFFRKNQPRRYGDKITLVPLDLPTAQLGLKAAVDRSPIGPGWAARYQQPETQEGRIEDLQRANPDFARRVLLLTSQLRAQGAMVFVESTVRPRERGLLLYGSFILSRSKSRRELMRNVRRLRLYNKQWKLNVPIRWLHPKGWRATVDAARQLADTYGVVYATQRGAKSSDHYDGSAVDLFVVNLPRTLTLKAPDGAEWMADLSGPEESRDLSLSPALIDWIEAHFRFKKLRSDYPHWSDAVPRAPKPQAR